MAVAITITIGGQQVRSLEWSEIEDIERDICYLYHQLVDYDYIMGDLAFGVTFRLPYWEYLHVSGLPANLFAFVRDGCLVMLLAMAWEVIDEAGRHLLDDQHLTACQTSLQQFSPTDPRTERLCATVQQALDYIANGMGNDQLRLNLIAAESDWVHRTYIRGYFSSRASRLSSSATQYDIE